MGDDDETLRDLVARVVDNAKAYARAEIAVARATALGWVARLKPAAIMVAIAVFLVQAALTVLVAALGLGLARWIGPAGGLALAAVLVLLVAGLLVWAAARRLGAKA